MSAASPAPRRILSLCLPRLSTDRLIRAERGRSWRSAAPPESEEATDRTAGPGFAEAGALLLTADAVASGATRLARRIGQATWVPATGPGPVRPVLAGPPIAVVARTGNALRLAAVDAVAEARGLAPGLGLADARARLPDLLVAEADPDGDRDLLDAIADWADRYTPLVAIDPVGPAPAAGLFLEIAGSAHLFGGEAALAADLVDRLKHQGFAARVGVADTPGAAWALARFAGHPALVAAARQPPDASLRTYDASPDGDHAVLVLAPGAERKVLAPLPLAALRLAAETVSDLERVGLKTVAAILDQPRAPLARRFGPDLARRLDQALGREEEPISPRRPVAALVAERRFAEPVLAETDVARVIRSLAGHLAGPLEARGEGARRLELALFRVDGAVTRIEVGASRPLRDPGLVLGLFAEKLKRLGDDLDAGFGFETLRLSVTAADRDDPAQIDLAGSAEAEADLARLVDRLGARLGLGRVRRALPEESHIPEAAARLVPAMRTGPEAEAAWAVEERPGPEEPIARPIRLFARPEPIEAVAEVPEGPPIRFRWRRAVYRVARWEGPERIAAEWWRHPLPIRGEAEATGDPSSDAPSPSRDGPPPLRPRQPVPSRTSGELHQTRDPADRLVGRGDPRSTAPTPASGSEAPTPAPAPLAAEPPRGSELRPEQNGYETEALPPGTPGLTRDYFRVEDVEGRRFWVFREGLYERETSRPRWFLQGLFA